MEHCPSYYISKYSMHWLQRLGYHHDNRKKSSFFVDHGHERPDVVLYQNDSHTHYLSKLEPRMRRWIQVTTQTVQTWKLWNRIANNSIMGKRICLPGFNHHRQRNGWISCQELQILSFMPQERGSMTKPFSSDCARKSSNEGQDQGCAQSWLLTSSQCPEWSLPIYLRCRITINCKRYNFGYKVGEDKQEK